MKIFQTYDDGGAINEVYYTELADGSYAIKLNLDDEYVKFLTKAQFDKMVKDAESKSQMLTKAKAFQL